MRGIYLDNHTTTKPSPEAVAAMQPFLTEQWGVVSAPHAIGHELIGAMDKAYEAIYSLLGAKEYDSFILTSSGAEAVTTAIQAAYIDVVRETGKNHLLTSIVDEAAVVLHYERLESFGCETGMIPVTGEGIVTPDALIDALTPRTALVSLSWANALTGVMHPVAELAEVCRERGIWFHLDATHVLGKVGFDLDEIAPDLISFNGDHLHAPKGTGGLWIRSGLRLSPLVVGGLDQDGQRAGSVSVALLAALGVAAEQASASLDHVATETARLCSLLLQNLPEAKLLFEQSMRTPSTIVLAFPGVTSDALLYALNRRGVYASFGGGAYQQLSLQLEAANVPKELANCAISLSLSRYTTEEEVVQAAKEINESVAALRQVSAHLVEVG